MRLKMIDLTPEPIEKALITQSKIKIDDESVCSEFELQQIMNTQYH